jgi:hypothetical protein
MNPSILRRRPVAASAFAVAAVCALILAIPGETVTTKYMNDLFIFLEGVHRIDLGQVPNRDFHTALGPLVYYIPALGYWLSGTMGGAMPTGMALLVMALAPITAHVLGSRMRPAIGIPLAAFLLLIVAVPINTGESIGALSFAMFYNRIGWAALGILLVMHLRPIESRPWLLVLDSASAAILILLMLYTKVSYAVVGIGFLALTLGDRKQRPWATAALVLVPLGALAVELVWGGTKSHVADLRLAGMVSGSLGTIDNLVGIVLRHLADLALFTLVAAFVLWRAWSVRDLLYFAYCAGAGWMLISQNFQQWGIITISVGAAVAAEILGRQHELAAEPSRSITTGAHLLLLAMLLPTLVHNTAALGLHGALAAMKYGETVPLEKFDRIRLARLWFDGDPTFVRYMASLKDGAAALAAMEGDVDRGLVLDFVNPFTAGLGLKPARGDSTWYHWGRTINEEHFPPAEQLFRDVRVVMEPKWAVEEWTARGMRTVYADYLAEHYEVAVETAEWKIYLPQPSPAETVQRSLPDEQEPAAGGG